MTSQMEACNEQAGVVRHYIIHSFREICLQFLHFRDEGFCCFERVCTGLQEDRDARTRFAIKRSAHIVALRAQFDTGDILEIESAARTHPHAR